jgi:hypothetical protein
MSYVLEPLVAGELGDGTELDTSTHPPHVRKLDYVLDLPTEEDLIESFPVFLVSEELAAALTAANFGGFRLDDAEVRKSDQYALWRGDLPHKRYRWLRPASSASADCWLDEHNRLCVSDRMYAVVASHRIDRCVVRKTS